MSEPGLEKLLGGFAADTLTPEEREQLFRAALHDQQLFNALADEQALKELLADPVTRRRLFQALTEPHGTGGWRSWLERFTRPAGLAWAGGIAVGVFAVVLGLNVYQESLRQASESAAVEETRPMIPSTRPPAAPPEQAPPKEMELKAKDTLIDSMAGREQAAASRPPRKSERDEKRTPLQQQESRKLDVPVAALGKSTEQPAASSDLRQAPPASPAGPEVNILAQEETVASAGASARALFYGDRTALKEMRLRSEAKEPEPARKPAQFGLQKTLDRTVSMKPLAFRYSFIAAGPELDPKVVADRTGTVTLTVESNQEAYVQIWKRVGDSLPELLLPAKETGRISLKTEAGQRQLLPIPADSDRLIIRLSRVPFGPITRQEAVMAGRGSVAQLTESEKGREEEATYVANPDPSAVELAVEIPIGTSAAR